MGANDSGGAGKIPPRASWSLGAHDTAGFEPDCLIAGMPGKFAGSGEVHSLVLLERNDGRIVADVVRLDKAHTKGRDPSAAEHLVKLFVSEDRPNPKESAIARRRRL